MLIVKILPGENIERALKRYRNKVRNTQQLKRIRNNQEFTKKSEEKRESLKKAIHKNEYLKMNEE
ncbi:30S ribosomal protein S21 [Flagellimonas taeanensis]|jgi:small subunit ribosomal protein S21|uniref:Small ribosomal subunit protein bS21 n=1 Tax=Flagellimonas taeanensis TaxID=1005926 RepID=A0A1M6YE40_9FLAO|nr:MULTISPECIES: 30S ribosomal protein S21 [Allomuricauda]MDC6383935.1 30S ribosomal protein S21 [Muricauda sp. SK9]MEE1961948.1 30S ribosomal protein S21 [Allomuricauda taeanensis]RIV48550.1 30S ribosomal protein S21 [Allomuricauda taeanensis]SFC07993.1 small subunit ribosomal protein S21 [Allomuricauda taeanensis]SHL16556.1 small subunit ribosomal protein S21 [Allomuricauda taeanensis]